MYETFGPDYFDASEFGCDEFADPTGRSALRKASRRNPRRNPCPTCGTPNVLTDRDVQLGYQCDACADRAEQGW